MYLISLREHTIHNSSLRCEFRVFRNPYSERPCPYVCLGTILREACIHVTKPREIQGNLVSRKCAIAFRCFARRQRDKESAKRARIRGKLRSTVRNVATSFVKSVCSPRKNSLPSFSLRYNDSSSSPSFPILSPQAENFNTASARSLQNVVHFPYFCHIFSCLLVFVN